MKRYLILLLAALLGGICTADAQSDARTLRFGGLLLDQDGMLTGDFTQLAATQNYGTARSMALGGAFTSLGGDLASMSINPAGMGMYRSNEISLTPMMNFQRSETGNVQDFHRNGRNRFSVANFGLALNVYESASSALTSFTVGLGLNRIADFNARYSYQYDEPFTSGGPVMPSIAEIFGQQLGQAGIYPDSEGRLGYTNNNPYYWGAILGYNGFLISPGEDAQGRFWTPDCIGHNASIHHYVDELSSGSINEFAIALGANFGNKFYVGATVSIQSVHKETNLYYGEDYRYEGAAVDQAGNPLTTQLDYMDYYQETEYDGSGIGLKLGMIWRPIENLRLGVAFHTPTYYSLDRSYRAYNESQIYNNDNERAEVWRDQTPYQNDVGNNSWNFTSPPRLLAGVSYTFGNVGLVSIDYQRDWYNGIRVKNIPYGFDISAGDYKYDFQNDYRATNTVRAGVEVKPLPWLALRVGGGYTDSMLDDEAAYFNRMILTEQRYLSAGVGFRLGRAMSLDVVYQNTRSTYTRYQLFYSRFVDTGEMNTFSGLFDTQYTRHNLALTLGFRF